MTQPGDMREETPQPKARPADPSIRLPSLWTGFLLGLFLCAALPTPSVGQQTGLDGALEIALQLVQAFNDHDPERMAALVADAFELYYVDETGQSTRALTGPAALREEMAAFFAARPDVRSVVTDPIAGPRFVAFREQIVGGSSSLAVYEVCGDRIVRAWYFPAEHTPSASMTAGLRPHDRIVFFGDSITEAGALPGGYVHLIAEALSETPDTEGVEVIGAGISGHKVPDLLARAERDVLAREPTLVVIYIGINDVWHWYRFDPVGTPPRRFETGLQKLVSLFTERGTRVMLATPSVIGEKPDGSNESDPMLDDYADMTRRVARTSGAALCDLRAAFLEALSELNPQGLTEGILTTDGVHLNERGNRFVADRFLDCLGAANRPRPD